MRAIDPDCPNFLDPKDAYFRGMHNIIDDYFRELLAHEVMVDDVVHFSDLIIVLLFVM